MRIWKVAVLLDLALLAGVGVGYAWWGRTADRLATELAETRASAERLERELAATRAAGGAPGDQQQWEIRGVVRAVLPEINVVVMSHEDIPGYMPAMTMGFRAAAPGIYEGVAVGDDVRFTLRGTPPNVVVTAIRRASKQEEVERR